MNIAIAHFDLTAAGIAIMYLNLAAIDIVVAYFDQLAIKIIGEHTDQHQLDTAITYLDQPIKNTVAAFSLIEWITPVACLPFEQIVTVAYLRFEAIVVTYLDQFQLDIKIAAEYTNRPYLKPVVAWQEQHTVVADYQDQSYINPSQIEFVTNFVITNQQHWFDPSSNH